MRTFGLFLLGLSITACDRRDDTTIGSSSQRADSPAAAARAEPRAAEPRVDEPRRPADSTTALARGIEPGSIPATPTPTVTTEASLAAMRAHLQRLDSASAQELQANVREHTKMLGDLLTTMRVEVQAATSSGRERWIAAADTVEGDLNKLAMAQGEQLRSAFHTHRNRVLKLLDGFRVLVPPR